MKDDPLITVTVTRPLHMATFSLVQRFADALADKLARAEQKYGYTDDWSRTGW